MFQGDAPDTAQILIAIFNLGIMGPIYGLALVGDHESLTTAVVAPIYYTGFINVLPTVICPVIFNPEFKDACKKFFGIKDAVIIQFSKQGKTKLIKSPVQNWFRHLSNVANTSQKQSASQPT